MLKDDIKKLINNLNGDAGVIVKNTLTQQSLLFNENMVFPSASIIKLPIIWELFKKVDEGKICLDHEIKLEEEQKVGGFGILKELHSGLNLSIRDIATLMIVLSDNVATNILIDMLDMENINKAIKHNNIINTVLQRKMMDRDAKKRGLDNFTSPLDVCKILEGFLNSDELSEESIHEIIKILKKQQCNNKLPVFMNPNVEFAHKTGDLPGAEHDVGILFSNKGPIIIIVLTKNLRDNSEGIKFNNEIGKIVSKYLN